MSTIPRMIAVDFDGTICDFNYPHFGKLKDGVVEALTQLRSLGFHIHIYSCRSSFWYSEIFTNLPCNERPVHLEMKRFLDENQIPYDSIDDGTKGKPMCDYYIDDKGVRFQNNWQEIAEAITAETLMKGVSLNCPTTAQVQNSDSTIYTPISTSTT